MKPLTYWTVRLALLAGAFGIWFSYQKGDGPAPNWSWLEFVGQGLAGAALCGLLGGAAGLVFDLIGAAWRRTRKFSDDMRESRERL